MACAAHVVVPARYGSTRLPGKPLAEILGKPMIVRVLEQAALAGCTTCVAAVDDERVAQVIKAAGHHAVMTANDHPSGSDRVMEVASILQWPDDDIVINLQGDEPLIPPSVIDALIAVLRNTPAVGIATVCEPILDRGTFEDPNVVKVVCDVEGNALYFSRSPIPYPRDRSTLEGAYRHVGIYGFRVAALRQMTKQGLGRLEDIEKLEQLRWLASGEKIRVVTTPETVPGGVDTPEDLERVIAHLSQTTQR